MTCGTSTDSAPVVVVGAGPGGLAVAAMLRRAGVPAVVVEREERVGANWAQRYDHLSLHTSRGGSQLPGLALGRACGQWVRRDDFVDYLERYRAHHRLRVRLGTEVCGIEAVPAGSLPGPAVAGAGRWRVRLSTGTLLARAVVVATGRCNTPFVPPWPGREGFRGRFLHSAEYAGPAAYRGQSVLVVGAGNSGTEIATVLGRQGARRVWIAVRTPPNILPRDFSRWHAVGRLTQFLPVAWRDRSALLTQRCAVADPTSFGIPRPSTGPFTRNAHEGNNPVLDHGFVAAVAAGHVRPVAAVTGFDAARVKLADGSFLTPDTVIAATGYRPHLDSLLSGLDVLDNEGAPVAVGAQTSPDAPHLYFAGYTNPLSGALYQAGVEARAIARALAARQYAPVPPQRQTTLAAVPTGTTGRSGTGSP